jgi:RNA polymerase sigma-70 factor (ECF subfamily)
MPTALDLFERHHLAVVRFLRATRLPAPDAEDLAQEVFLRVLRALPAYEERGMERAWVFRIARNVCLDHIRARNRAPTAVPVDDRPWLATPPRQAARAAIDEALGRLGEEERQAFLLREVAGLGYAEIADATGTTKDAVRSRIHRARLALRQTLGGQREARAAGGRGE